MVRGNVHWQVLEAHALAGFKELVSDFYRGWLDALRYELRPAFRALAGAHEAALTLADEWHAGLLTILNVGNCHRYPTFCNTLRAVATREFLAGGVLIFHVPLHRNGAGRFRMSLREGRRRLFVRGLGLTAAADYYLAHSLTPLQRVGFAALALTEGL